MLRRLILPLALVGLAGCGQGFPEAIPATVPTTAATTTTTIADTPTTPPPPTDPPTTPAPPTEPPTTPAPTTEAPAPTTEAPAPTTEAPAPTTAAPPTTTKATEPPKPKPKPAPAGNFEVLTVAGLGSPIDEAGVIQQIDESGLTPDSVTEYGTYGGPANLPFVNVEGGRLSAIDIETGDTIKLDYGYALKPADGATAESLATAAAEPLKQKYPDYSVQTRETKEGELTLYAIELDSPPGSGGDWTVYGITRTDLPTVAEVNYKYYESPDEPATGLDIVPAKFRDAVKGPLEEAGAPLDQIVTSRTRTGIDYYGDGLVGVEVAVDFKGQDFATVKEMAKGLADKGWTAEEEEKAVVYTKGTTELKVDNNDEYEYIETKIIVKLDQ